MNNTLFYDNLENHKGSVNELLSKTNHFHRVPSDWYIIVTDIEGSTKSVDKGFSEVINLIATGSIIAALNIASKYNIHIPFFFGGDGATMLIPSNLLDEIMEALIAHKENIQTEFELYLRVGNIPVADIYKNNRELKIAKASINKLHTIPVILGNGLQFAEDIIKSRDKSLDKLDNDQTNLDLDGMECRWNKISPPANSNEVVSLLINAVNESKQASIFQIILDQTDKIYGPLKVRNPISVPKLKLNISYRKIKTELKAGNKKFGVKNFFKLWVIGLLGKYYYLPNNEGRKYLKELEQLSDILVMDGRINMVISGTSKQRQLLTDFLDDLEEKKLIVYGTYVSEKSIMSCYVRNRNAKHIHFVDGGNSGYTKAAKVLKEKMRQRLLCL